MKKNPRIGISLFLALLLLIAPAAVLAEGGEATEPPTEETPLPDYESSVELTGKVGVGNGFRGSVEENGQTALIAGTSVPNNPAINGAWAVINRETSKLCLSFTMQTLTEACPRFTIRIRDNVKLFHTPLLTVRADGGICALGSSSNLIATIGTDATDFYIEIDVVWASLKEESANKEPTTVTKSDLNAGSLALTVYVNGVLVGLYEQELYVWDPTSSLQMLAQANENLHVNETNGVYLYDGVPNVTEEPAPASDEPTEEPSEEKTVIGTNDVEGWYAVCKLSNMRAYSASVRRGFAYAESELYPTGNVLTTGLRFSFGLDRRWFDSLEGEKRVGAIIFPTELLDGRRFTPAFLESLTAGRDYVEDSDVGLLPSGDGDDAYRFMASLVRMNTHNFARAFTAVGYVETADGVRHYTGAYSTSANETALARIAEQDFTDGTVDEETRTLITEALARTPMLETDENGELRISEIANYETPYILIPTADGLGFELIASDVTCVGALIIDGTVYTSGWLPVLQGDAILTVPVYAPTEK